MMSRGIDAENVTVQQVQEWAEQLAKEMRLRRLDSGMIWQIAFEFDRLWRDGRIGPVPEAYIRRWLRNADTNAYREDDRWARAFQIAPKEPDDNDPAELAANREIVELARKLTTREEQEVLNCRLQEELTVRAAAERLGVSPSRVHRTGTGAVSRLRRWIASELPTTPAGDRDRLPSVPCLGAARPPVQPTDRRRGASDRHAPSRRR